MKKIQFFFVFIMLASLLAACAQSPQVIQVDQSSAVPATAVPAQPTSLPPTAVPPTSVPTEIPTPTGPIQGGTLKMSGYYGIIDSLDPISLHEATAIMSVSLIYTRLFRIAADGQTLEGDAVESYEISPDGLVYTFKLRPNLKFSDGTPVTMDDVVFSLTRSMTSLWWVYPTGTTLNAVDDTTFTLTLLTPFAPFLDYIGTYYTSIYPKAAVEAQGDAFWQNPVGSGPFMVKEWTPEYLDLVRNPYYYEEGKPYLDELIIYPGSDDNTRMLKFLAGELDVDTSVPYNQAAPTDAMDNITVRVDPLLSEERVGIFLGIQPFEDKNVRMALNYATDRQAIIDTVLFGYGEPSSMPIAKVKYYNDTAQYTFDLDKAKQYMAASAYPDGFETTLYYISGNTTESQVGVLLQQQWAQIGVTVDLASAEMFTLWDMEPQQQVPLEMEVVTSGILDPSQNANVYVCAFQTDTTHYCDQSLDTLLTQANQMLDAAQREAAYEEIQQMGFDDAAWVPLYNYPSLTAEWDYVKGLSVLPTGDMRLWEVWLDK
jgi:peptide/nickel transport system substrate-binding protein